VNWDDAMKFCEMLTTTERNAGRLPEGWKYTLPTEAQWEYACRAGTTTPHSFDEMSSNSDDFVNVTGVGLTDDGWRASLAQRVGQLRPNRWGLYDMHGNVAEWCRDWYAKRLAGGVDPEGPVSGWHRVFRCGGSLVFDTSHRSASRAYFLPEERHFDLGFRVALVQSGK